MKYVLLAMSALSIGCGNKELEAEKVAFSRFTEQGKRFNDDLKRCCDQYKIDETDKKEKEFGAKCKPLNDQLNRLTEAGNMGRAWMDTMAKIQASPDCNNENLLRKKWLEDFELVKKCQDKSLKSEMEILKAEYVAACMKCGVKERCEFNANKVADMDKAREAGKAKWGCEK